MVSLMKLIKVYRHFILEKNGLGKKNIFFSCLTSKFQRLKYWTLDFLSLRTLNFFHNTKKM